MTGYFRKPDTIAVGLSFLPKIVKYRLHNLDGSSVGVALRLPAVGTLKRYSKALEYEYRVKIVALGTLKRYSIISLTLYLE
jgi:hypothetical protein